MSKKDEGECYLWLFSSRICSRGAAGCEAHHGYSIPGFEVVRKSYMNDMRARAEETQAAWIAVNDLAILLTLAKAEAIRRARLDQRW